MAGEEILCVFFLKGTKACESYIDCTLIIPYYINYIIFCIPIIPNIPYFGGWPIINPGTRLTRPIATALLRLHQPHAAGGPLAFPVQFISWALRALVVADVLVSASFWGFPSWWKLLRVVDAVISWKIPADVGGFYYLPALSTLSSIAAGSMYPVFNFSSASTLSWCHPHATLMPSSCPPPPPHPHHAAHPCHPSLYCPHCPHFHDDGHRDP